MMAVCLSVQLYKFLPSLVEYFSHKEVEFLFIFQFVYVFTFLLITTREAVVKSPDILRSLRFSGHRVNIGQFFNLK